jgi:hypothetical protein
MSVFSGFFGFGQTKVYRRRPFSTCQVTLLKPWLNFGHELGHVKRQEPQNRVSLVNDNHLPVGGSHVQVYQHWQVYAEFN